MATRIPKGLAIERMTAMALGWKVVHKASGLKVAGPFKDWDAAVRVTTKLADVDWTRSAEELRADRELADRVVEAWKAEL